MNNAITKIIILLVVTIFLSCKNKDRDQIESVSVYPVKTISQINDSTFLSQVMDINTHEGNLYFTDFKNNRVVCTDTRYNLIRIFGRPGKGPGEFLNIGGCVINNEELYSYNNLNSSIQKYSLSSTQFINAISVERGIFPYGFIFKNNLYYFSHIGEEFPILVLNMDGKKQKSFGSNEHVIELNKGLSRVFNFEYIDERDYLLAMCISEPVIEQYTKEGQLVKVFDFSSYKPFNELIQYYTEQRKQPDYANVAFGFIEYTFYKSGKLYLLIYTYDNKQKKKFCNTIMIFKVNKNDITPYRCIELKTNNNSWFSAFTIYSNKIVAYDALNYEINEYTLPN